MSEETEPWRYPRLSDRDLLLCIGRDLKRLYAVTLQQPLPDDIEALLQKIEKAELNRMLRKHRAGDDACPLHGPW
ncbi:NepR family anti-sigma factor [Microvirga ossetica]|uniref:NepR family anti-sigma factor n=1 Tax=Microvirga ossetica TaxID=1882682 RepID=UPI0012FFF54E